MASSKYDRRNASQELRRSALLGAIMEAPSGSYGLWEQGFIAALTMTEAQVDTKVEELSLREYGRMRDPLNLREFAGAV